MTPAEYDEREYELFSRAHALRVLRDNVEEHASKIARGDRTRGTAAAYAQAVADAARFGAAL